MQPTPCSFFHRVLCRGLGRAAAPKAKRGPLSSTAVKDPNAPKKPGSAYNFFTKEKTAEVRVVSPLLDSSATKASRIL